MVHIEKSSSQVLLRVERVGYLGKDVTLSYMTQELEGPEIVAGVRVYHALEGADYQRAQGSLNFAPGDVSIHQSMTSPIFCHLPSVNYNNDW